MKQVMINELFTEQTLFITCELKLIVKHIVLHNIVNLFFLHFSCSSLELFTDIVSKERGLIALFG